MGEIKAPDLTYEDINARAAELLESYGRSATIPVNIEAMVEFDAGLSIVPIRALQDRFAVDGFLSMDMTEIIVDEAMLERHPTRYRFTLAHEFGHLILHASVFKDVDLSCPEE